MVVKKISKKITVNLIAFFLFTLLFVTLVGATLTTEVNSFKFTDGNFKNMNESTDLEIIYHTTLGDNYVANKTDNKFYFAPNSKVYCWNGCNVYPKFIIYSKEIKRGNETLAIQELNIQNGFNNDLHDIFGIYEEKKYAAYLEMPKIIGQVIDSEDSQKFSEGDYFVKWNGEIITQESRFYEFNLNALRDSKVIVNNTVFIDSSEGLHNGTYLEKGTYPINVSYQHNTNKEKPNLFWNLSGNDEIIPEQNLVFLDGVVQKTSNGEKGGFIDLIPESYSPDYELYPSGILYYPNTLENTQPLIMVHGLHGEYPYWNQIPERLASLDNDVWQFYYTDANVSNFMTSGLLKFGVDTALLYYPSGTKANIAAHSMGTLVTLGYISNLGKDAFGNQISYTGKIDGVALIGGPIHGSYLANRVLKGESAGLFCGDILNLDPDDPEAQAYLDLAVGSEFTWLLDKNGLNNNVRYLAIAGSEGIPCIPDETYQGDTEPGDGNDGFLAVASGSLLDKDVDLVIFTGDNHANLIGQKELCIGICSGACQDYLLPGFCHDSSKVWREVYIINGFFRDYSENTLKNYLFSEDYYIEPNDISNPYNKGSIVLKVTSAQQVNEVKLRKQNTGIFYFLTKYHDDIHFTQIDNWFYYSNNNPAMPDTNSLYGITFPKGNYDVYVNGQDIGQDVEIKGAQTTMMEINLDGSSCVTPINNMTITQNTTFCSGQYYLPDGIKIGSGNITVDCNGAKLSGNPNAINDSSKQGVWIQGRGKTLKNCEISNYFYGIFSSSDNLISNKILNNTIYNNKEAIFALNKHEISFNKIYNNSLGIDATISGITITINNNSIYNNSYGILFGDYGTQMTSNINWNEIYNNPSFNLVVLGSDNINATNNWWGTNNATEIAQSILDFYDDNSRGIVYFVPFIERITCLVNLTNTTWSNWTNISCLKNDKMNQSRSRVQYDANNCGTIVNQTLYEYRANETCNYCSSNIVGPLNTTWSMCNASDNQTRIAYYLDLNYSSCCLITNLSSDCGIKNQTYQNRTEIQGCNYCSPNPVNTTWTEWQNQTSCLNNIQIQNRSRTEYDANYSTCYAITHLLSDLFINITTWEFRNLSCNSSFTLNVNFPNEDVYNKRKLNLDLSSNIILSRLEYIDNSDSRPKWSTLCRNCQTYNKSKTFSDGNHEIVFKGTLSNGQNITNQTVFLVDSTKPRISTTKPQSRKYTNGSDFYIKYTENNCQNIKLLLGGSQQDLGICESGKNIEKYFMQNLETFDGTEIEYKFTVTDTANNIDESRSTKVKVDATAPEITNFNASVIGKYIYFNMTILNEDKNSFDEVEYIDNSDSKPKWKSLCTSLKNGICYKKVSFKSGQHNLIVRALDKAGNSAQREINLPID